MSARTAAVLPLEPGRDRLMRFESATVLGRFHYLERALTISCAAWIPAVQRLDAKAALARAAWQNALTADALRSRVFELRYPDRTLERDADEGLVQLYEASLDAPSASALLQLLVDVLLPELVGAYERYLLISDLIADGPSHRFLQLALHEKAEQQRLLAEMLILEGEEDDPKTRETWTSEFRRQLEKIGGVPVEGPPPGEFTWVSGKAPGQPFALREDPARDDRYASCNFYWPDTFDPDFPYGEGIELQVRSAISHLNEVWAVEAAGAILHGLSDRLGWEFIRDAARWLYDESRHMMMGKHRLEWWGFQANQVPLGAYIYEACRGEDVLYRLGMLAYFETKNIGKKKTRATKFQRLGDRTSGRDMDFDWADESIHAGYGRRWLKAALAQAGRPASDWREVVAHCEELIAARVAEATEDEKATSYAHAKALVADAYARHAPATAVASN